MMGITASTMQTYCTCMVDCAAALAAVKPPDCCKISGEALSKILRRKSVSGCSLFLPSYKSAVKKSL